MKGSLKLWNANDGGRRPETIRGAKVRSFRLM